MVTTKKAYAIILVLFCTSCVFVAGAYAGDTYYVDGVTGKDSNSGNLEKPWKTINKANQTLQAGDTVYIRSGTYYITGTGIDPVNTGRSGNRITYSAHNNEKVTLVGNSSSSTAINLDSSYGTVRSYIKVHGITFKNFYHHLYIKKGDYNEISHCTFSGMYDSTSIDWRGSTFEGGADYNWIHGCTFEKYGTYKNTGGGYYDDAGVLLEIGWDSGPSAETGNVIEDCVFQYGGHHVLGPGGKNNVLRNCYLQHDNWIDVEGKYYGNRVLYVTGQKGEDEQNLIEGNRIGYAGPTAESDQNASEGGLFSQRWCVIRHNVFLQHDQNAMYIHVHGSDHAAEENYIYNNTYWYNGHDETERWKDTYHTIYSHAIVVWSGGSTSLIDDNVFKNNLFYQNDNEANSTTSIAGDRQSAYDAQIYSHNWEGGIDGDPKFVNISGTPDPENRYQFDFRLQSDSKAIDGGTYHTQANGSGSNSTTLVVDDAKYFQDGWGNGAGGGASVKADWISVGTVSNTVQISSINYATNTITLSSPMTWSNNANIWLYKNSSGKVVLHGTAPDQGAYEFESSSSAISPPKNVKLVTKPPTP